MSNFQSVKINQALNFAASENSNAGICNSSMIGVIELFNSTTIPNNYLICNGSQISTSDNSDYDNLIQILTGSTSETSAYLPNFTDEVYPLGWSTNSNTNLSNYSNTSEANYVGNSDLDINYFPSHKHTIDGGSIKVKPTTDNTYIHTTITGDSPPDKSGSSGSREDEQGKNEKHNLAGDHTHSFENNQTNTNVSYSIDANYNIQYEWDSKLTNNLNENENSIKYIPESCYLVFAIRYK